MVVVRGEARDFGLSLRVRVLARSLLSFGRSIRSEAPRPHPCDSTPSSKPCSRHVSWEPRGGRRLPAISRTASRQVDSPARPWSTVAVRDDAPAEVLPFGQDLERNRIRHAQLLHRWHTRARGYRLVGWVALLLGLLLVPLPLYGALFPLCSKGCAPDLAWAFDNSFFDLGLACLFAAIVAFWLAHHWDFKAWDAELRPA